MTDVEAIKIAWNYSDKVEGSKERIMAQARLEDMSYFGYVAWDLRK